MWLHRARHQTQFGRRLLIVARVSVWVHNIDRCASHELGCSVIGLHKAHVVFSPQRQ
jgi:hypothetical protein